MDSEALDKQFQAMEGNKQVQATAGNVPPAPPIRRRITTAQLQKEIDQIRTEPLVRLAEWCSELASRIDAIEKATEPKTTRATADLKKQIDVIEEILNDNILQWLRNHDEQIGALEDAPTKLQPSFVPDINARMEAIENATGTLAGAVRQIAEGDALWELRLEAAEEAIASLRAAPARLAEVSAPSEIEFAKPPEIIEEAQTQLYDLAAVADICLTMNDILMITRALKDAGDLSDGDRITILQVACRRAGEAMTPGLQIRAGVKYVVT